MKQTLQQWIQGVSRPDSSIALAVRLPDRTVLTRHLGPDLSPAALEQALRFVAETFQVLALHRSTSQRLTYVFDKSKLFAASRPDGACLGLFIPASDKTFTDTQFAALAGEFNSVARR